MKREEPHKKSKARKTHHNLSFPWDIHDSAPQVSEYIIHTVVPISEHRPGLEFREEATTSPTNKLISQLTLIPKNKGKENVGDSSKAPAHSQEEVRIGFILVTFIRPFSSIIKLSY